MLDVLGPSFEGEIFFFNLLWAGRFEGEWGGVVSRAKNGRRGSSFCYYSGLFYFGRFEIQGRWDGPKRSKSTYIEETKTKLVRGNPK